MMTRIKIARAVSGGALSPADLALGALGVAARRRKMQAG